jgi:hypothetical protein
MQSVFCEVCLQYTVDPISVEYVISFVSCLLEQKTKKCSVSVIYVNVTAVWVKQ